MQGSQEAIDLVDLHDEGQVLRPHEPEGNGLSPQGVIVVPEPLDVEGGDGLVVEARGAIISPSWRAIFGLARDDCLVGGWRRECCL